MPKAKTDAELRKLGRLPHKKAYPEVTIAGKSYKTRDLLSIDSGNLDLEYRTITHWIATVRYDLQKLRRQHTTATRLLETRRGREYLRIRREAEVKLTEGMINANIGQLPILMQMRGELEDLSHEIEMRKVLICAMEDKKDMLVNLGAELRNRHRRN